jgi:CDP-diacylglycerol--serine O-phosphatidyltransferase
MFNLANLFTAANLLSGITAIVLALTGSWNIAPYAIFAGLIFDFLDGFVARFLKNSSEFGKQLDSLADIVTFGVAPGVIMMVVLAINTDSIVQGESYDMIKDDFTLWINNMIYNNMDGSWFPLAGLMIPFFSLFRLAKFNVDSRQTDSFIGLPTPANTLFFMTFPLVLGHCSDYCGASSIIPFIFNPWMIVGLILLMGILMISEIPLFSLKLKNFGFKGNEIRIVFLLTSLVFLLLFGLWSMALIVLLYLTMSIAQNIFYKKKKNEI